MTLDEAVKHAFEEERYLARHYARGDTGAIGWLAGATYYFLKKSDSPIGTHEERMAAAKKLLDEESKYVR